MKRIDIQANGYVFPALTHGPDDGPLVLLLHGFPQSSLEWEAQLTALGDAGYRAVAPDQRGYTPTARPRGVEHYDIGHLVQDVLSMAEQLGSPRFHLAGHDWGAIVAWVLAARHPDRVRTLTAVSVPHPSAFADAYEDPNSDQGTRSAYVEVFRSAHGEGEAMLLGEDGQGLARLFRHVGLTAHHADAYQALHGAPGALSAALDWYRAQHPCKMRGVLPVARPTLLVWSDGDPAISREAAAASARYVTARYRFEAYPGVDHWLPELIADDLSQLLLEHLRRFAERAP